MQGAWESARTNVPEPSLVGLEEAQGCYQQRESNKGGKEGESLFELTDQLPTVL